MRYQLRAAACALLLALSCTGILTSPAAAAAGDIAEADAIAAVVNKVTPTSPDNPRLPLQSDGRQNGGLNGRSSTSTRSVSIPRTSSGDVRVEATANGSARAVRLSLPPVSGARDAVVASDGTVTFASKTAPTSLAIQAFDQGVRIHVVLKSALASSAYAYVMSLPTGGSVQLLANGGVAILASDNSFGGGFAPPWATDSDGRAVPTHYELRGSTLMQIVDHTAGQYTYPVVADPYYGLTLIDHASWVWHTEGWTFAVTPTFWARMNAGSYSAGAAGWDELYDRYRNSGLNTNLNGMRDQYICHQVFVAVRDPGRATWNIDEWRPDVGWFQTVNSQCNPGGPKWFD